MNKKHNNKALDFPLTMGVMWGLTGGSNLARNGKKIADFKPMSDLLKYMEASKAKENIN